jgi:hypothetical protein
MLCCFTPLTLLCIAVLANLGRMQGKAGMLALTVAAAGPIGLIVAFKVVVLNPERSSTDDRLGAEFVVREIPSMRLSGRRCQRRSGELRFD